MEEGSNFLKDGVKATVGHAGKVMQSSLHRSQGCKVDRISY